MKRKENEQEKRKKRKIKVKWRWRDCLLLPRPTTILQDEQDSENYSSGREHSKQHQEKKFEL